MDKNIARAKRIIKDAEVILITAGAGMGVDSGLPDFRGNQGFWRAYPVIAKLGHSFVEMANPNWFHINPKLAWAFYGHRLNLYRETNPHQGFQILRELVKLKRDYFIFTSNVDGQFQKAGFDEDKIYECHGSIHYFQCTSCKTPIYSAENEQIEVDMERFEALNIPKCPNCGKVARPNILMFEDGGWDESRSEAQAERWARFETKVKAQGLKLAIIEIGAGVHIPTVRYKTENTANFGGGFAVRINPREYHIERRLGVGIKLGGLEGLRRVIEI